MIRLNRSAPNIQINGNVVQTSTSVALIALFLAIVSIASAQPSIVIDPAEFNFELPHGVSNAGVINVANNGDSLLVVDVDQRQPRRDSVVRILIWTRFTDEEWELQNMLNSLAVLEVDHRFTFYDGLDLDEMTELLDMTHVLIIPDQEYGSLEELSEAGELFGEALNWFIVERGLYIIGAGCNGETASFLAGADLIHIEIEDANLRIECEAADVHPLNYGVQRYLALASSNIHTCEDEDALAITCPVDRDGNNITARRLGEGGIVYMGMDWVQYNDEMTQLLINAVLWFRGGSNWLILEQFNGHIEPNSSEDLFFSIESRITPEPGEYSQDIVLGSNDPEHPELVVPVNLTVTEWQPADMSLEPDEIFMISEPDVDTLQVVLIRNNGDGVLFTSIELEIDTDWLTINRHQLTVNPGVMDRIVLYFHSEYAGDRVQENRLIFEYENPDPVRVELPIIYYAAEDFGGIEGDLYDIEDNTPVSDAVINIHGIRTTSDENGQFRFENIPPFVYIIRINHPDYLESTIYDVRVSADQVTDLNIPLYYCNLETDLEDHIVVTLTEETLEQIDGEFRNSGNGPLTYESKFNDLVQIPHLNPWQIRFTVSGGELTSASEIKGAVLSEEYLLLSAHISQNQPNLIYFINRDGELVDSIEQPVEYVRGMSDIAWDGELIYGSDWNEIIGFDLEGEIQVRIPEPPFYYCRAIAWDERNERFWVADARSDVVAINRDGDELVSYENPGMSIYGIGWLSYTEDDYNLYLFCRDGPDNTQIHRMNSETGETEFLLDIPSEFAERAGGLTISGGWEARYWSVIAQFTGGSNRTVIYNLDRRHDWAQLIPSSAAVQSGSSLPVSIFFDSRGFHTGSILEGYIAVDGKQRGGIDTLRVTMNVLDNSVPDRKSSSLLPDAYEISTYPNPFNDQLTVRYRAPIGRPVQLSIYDIQGRLVDTIIQTVGNGMENTVAVKAGNIGSGLYFIALEAENSKYLNRVVLLR